MKGEISHNNDRLLLTLCVVLALTPASSLAAFDSGSTGALGAFNPTSSIIVDLPPDGILNYTTVNIPAGVTVKFKKNQTNTPVVMLATGDVTIAGTIDVSGTHAPHVGPTGDGVLADDGNPGLGGPGGYDGGRGGVPNTPPGYFGGAGRGPGGGRPGEHVSGIAFTGGGGGGYGAAGTGSYYSRSYNSPIGQGGPAYGSQLLLPLLGGSGGGGGAGGGVYHGTGGGGGGGAILIASSGTVTVTGTITAKGGNGGDNDATSTYGGTGGGGSGGAIRIVATKIAGNGSILAQAGAAYGMSNVWYEGGNGGVGRIRLEAEISQRTAATDPAYTLGQPGSIFLAGLPSLRITSVGDVVAPANPSGSADITFPATLANPVTVQFATTGVPPGSAVKLTVKPAIGAPAEVTSAGLVGTTDSATASVSVNLPKGPSVLLATATYTLSLAQGEALSVYARGERVERVEIAASSGGESMVTLVTVSGKKYTVPSNIPTMVSG